LIIIIIIVVAINLQVMGSKWRVSGGFEHRNFGTIEIAWGEQTGRPTEIKVSIRGEAGQKALEQTVRETHHATRVAHAHAHAHMRSGIHDRCGVYGVRSLWAPRATTSTGA
jgi:hypothetical protein